MPEITMPRLSDSMEEGTIVEWLKEDGALVKRGEPVVEIETDKATLEYEADAEGALSIVVGDGETAAVGAVIAYVGERSAVTPAPVAPAANGSTGGHGATAAVSASPVARRVAAAMGLNLESVMGTGRRGRILKADVRAASQRAASPPATLAAASNGDGASARGTTTVEPLSRIQSTVARRMAEAKATVPDFWTSIDVDMAAVLALRGQLKEVSDRPPSINDFVVAAAARALRRHPRLNGGYRDGTFERWERVNVGVAVATENGLIVPTVFDADRASIGHLTGEVRRLAERVRSGTVTAPELAGGTFTVSNLGMYGVDRFGGIINAPQSGILCVGAAKDRPWAVDGEVCVRPVATMTLVADHRIVYGADAAAFLASVAELLARPLAILT